MHTKILLVMMDQLERRLRIGTLWKEKTNRGCPLLRFDGLSNRFIILLEKVELNMTSDLHGVIVGINDIL